MPPCTALHLQHHVVHVANVDYAFQNLQNKSPRTTQVVLIFLIELRKINLGNIRWPAGQIPPVISAYTEAANTVHKTFPATAVHDKCTAPFLKGLVLRTTLPDKHSVLDLLFV